MENKNLIILVCLSIVIVSALAIYTVFMTKEKYYEVLQIPYEFRVTTSHYIEMNADTDALHFGGIPLGSAAKKSIVVKNNYEKPVFVTAFFNDTFSDWFFVTPNNFTLGPGESEELEYTLYTKNDSELQNVSGYVYVWLAEK